MEGITSCNYVLCFKFNNKFKLWCCSGTFITDATVSAAVRWNHQCGVSLFIFLYTHSKESFTYLLRYIDNIMMQLEHLKIISRKRPCGSGRLCYRNCSSLIFVLADTSASGRSVSASDSTIDFSRYINISLTLTLTLTSISDGKWFHFPSRWPLHFISFEAFSFADHNTPTLLAVVLCIDPHAIY